MARTKAFDEQAVLEKAMHLFWKNGFHATSMQDLVDHLGINRASLYNTFGGKRELFDQAFARYRNINTQYFLDFFDSKPSIKEAFAQLFKQSVLQGAGDPDMKGCFVVNCTAEFLPDDAAMLHTAVHGIHALRKQIFGFPHHNNVCERGYRHGVGERQGPAHNHPGIGLTALARKKR